MSNLIVKLLVLVLSLMKALWNSVVAIAWGLASFFLLGVLLAYYKQDPSAILSFLPTMHYLTEHWIWFFTAFFIFEVLYNYRGLIQKGNITEERKPKPRLRKWNYKEPKQKKESIEDEMKREDRNKYMRKYMRKKKEQKKEGGNEENHMNAEVTTGVEHITDVIESENELPKQIEDAKIEPIKLPEDEKKEKKRAYMREYMREYKKKKKAQQQDVVDEVKVENGS